MKRLIGILIIILIGVAGCNNYKEVKNEDLKSAFIFNSSSTFKGYFYGGTDKYYHYFVSKWDFQRDNYFKLPVDKLTIKNIYKFDPKIKELKIELFKDDNEEFAQNEFYKLYIAKEVK